MALTEHTEEDKIEVVSEFKIIQVRTATIIKKDGKEISRSFHRHAVAPNATAEEIAAAKAKAEAEKRRLEAEARQKNLTNFKKILL